MPGHGRARMRTSPIFRESAANGRTRERIADAAVKQTERCRKRYERFTFCGRNAFFSGNLFFSQLRVSASVLRKERGR